MLCIKTGFEIQFDREQTYKYEYERIKDAFALHRYIACLLLNRRYSDCNQQQKKWLREELNKFLHIIVHTKDAKPYEALFYFELNHAMGNFERIHNWLSQYPMYGKFCNICVQSYEFLLYIGTIDAAKKCLNELFYVGIIDHAAYVNYKCQLLQNSDDRSEEFLFLENVILDMNYNVSKLIAERYVFCGKSLKQKEDDVLKFLKQGVFNNISTKWISYYYAKLCLEKGMVTEVRLQCEKLKNTIIFVHNGGKVHNDTIKKLVDNYFMIYSLLKNYDNTFEDDQGIDFITKYYPEVFCFEKKQ